MDTPPPMSSSDPSLTGALPGDQASGTRPGGGVLAASEFDAVFEEFAGVRKTAQSAYGWTQKLAADKKAAVMEKVDHMINYAHQMEDVLVKKLAGNRTAVKSFIAYVGKLDAKSARGTFGPMLSRLSKQLNVNALRGRATAAEKAVASQLAALKSKITGQ